MPPRRLTRAAAVALGLALAAPAGAIGFGAAPGSVGYGRPLDVAVPLRLEAGEAVPAGCLRADVVAGERRLAPEAVVVRFEPSADGGVVRVRSAAALHEPVIEVGLTVGCAPSVSRRFTFFADPPAAGPPPLPDAAPARAGAGGSMSGRPVAAPGAPSSRAVAVVAPDARRAAAATPPPVLPPARPAAAAVATAGPVTPGPAAVDDRPLARRAQLESQEPPIALRAAALTAAPRPAAPALAPRPPGAALGASAAAVPPTHPVELAQLVAMRAELGALHAAAAADRRAIEQLRAELARAEARFPWQPWALVAGLGLAAAGLGWRLHRLQRGATGGPVRPSPGRAAAAPAPVVGPDPEPPATVAAAGAGRPPSARVAADSLDEPPQPARSEAAARPPGPAAVDELIDLEQQAEFFVVIGDEDAAIDLLHAHLRRTGGASPVPQLRLLDIYRRRGDQEAWERTRGRFSRRFGAQPVVEGAGADRDSGLLGQPGLLEALQRAWPEPIDTMASLEALLFRQGGGEVFDLQTYRDALLLYGVARDLLRRGDAPAGQVDLLLPLAADAALVAEAPYITAAQPSLRMPIEDGPLAPVDLDLGEAAAAAGRDAVPPTPGRPS